MVAFGHTAVGVITGLGIYQLTQNSNQPIGLAISFSAGVVTHYITDFIPHGHFFKYKDFKKKVIYAIIFDFALSMLLFGGLSYLVFGLSAPFWFIAFAIIGAQLPDILDGSIHAGLISAKGLLKWEYDFHMSTHWHGKLYKGLTMAKKDIWQACTVILAVIILSKAFV